jgi:hypothetical protein
MPPPRHHLRRFLRPAAAGALFKSVNQVIAALEAYLGSRNAETRELIARLKDYIDREESGRPLGGRRCVFSGLVKKKGVNNPHCDGLTLRQVPLVPPVTG